MKEYIEREALIDEINIAPVSMSICMNVDECKGRIYERERLLRIINQATAADVVPVRHGRWIEEDDSCCGFHATDIVCSECNKISEFGKFSYCPNCGARMEV